MGLWDGIVSTAKVLANPLAAVTGSVLESKGQSSANAMNMQIMREQQAWNRDERLDTQKWMKEMSDTSHQRQVKDLRAAGINPILTATGGSGASTPSSSPSSAGSAVAQNVMSGKSKIALEMLTAIENLKLMKTQKHLTTQQGQTEMAKTERTAAEATSARAKADADELKYGRRKTKTGQFLDWSKEYLDTINPLRKRERP